LAKFPVKLNTEIPVPQSTNIQYYKGGFVCLN
jgi:hypothetical protein